MSDTGISLFGNGFIGSRYASMFPCEVEGRNATVPHHPRIIYTISTVHNYNIYDNPHLDINTNLNHLIDVLDGIRKSGMKIVEINYISTFFVYGAQDIPFRETYPCDPKGFYSITKRTAEQLLASYCQTFGISYRILRLANVLGESEKHYSLKKNALQYFVREIVNDRPINPYRETSIRDFIYVDDVCRAIHTVVEYGRLNEIYNIGNGVPVLFSDVLQYVIDKTGYDASKITYGRSAFHDIVQTNIAYMDIQKLTLLGYRPTMTIWQILDKLIEYYQKEKTWNLTSQEPFPG